jgi:V/A-type H+-transporting ATPase subunit C
MGVAIEQPMIDFYRYPPIGGDDWRYAFETAQVRVLELQMLSRATLADMANAASFEQTAELLRPTEYALPVGAGIPELEQLLSTRRSALRRQFEDWMHDKAILTLFRARDDFANLRLAIRRTLTKKPIGSDYSKDGNFPPEQFAEVFENENYELLPDYMANATEQAIVAYYQDKDIRRIDYAIDAAEAQYNLHTAEKLGSVFLLGLFRIQTDVTNIRTMLRLKLAESQQREVFLTGGYIETERLLRAGDIGAEAVASPFFVTPYFETVQAGAVYAASEKSFLKIEQQCEQYLDGYLQLTITITAGPQPIIAYLLTKEKEIRMVRLILTAKKNNLNPKLILDRIS